MVEGAIRDIVIVGGGTAGWMAAAAFARFAGRTHRITLVESDAIGTVGVGEATIPQIRLFNQALGLDEDEFLRETQGTYKLGIEFDGWLRPGHSYMHAFGSVGRGLGLLSFHHYWLRAEAEGFAAPLGDYCLNAAAAYGGRMARTAPLPGSPVPDMPYAFHFDASLYARYLRQYAEARGVTRIEGRIEDVCRNGETGLVEALRIAGDRAIAGQLFIDCSGFRGLLIEGAMAAGFEDWSGWLPCDRAVAVPSARTDPLLPYTRSTAREAGWQWRIPLQHRTGNGLVYSSQFLGDDAAAETLLANLDGAALGDPKPLRFVTGKRRRMWVGNVVAMGLAAGFMEPLESTSIHLVQTAISRLLALLPNTAFSEADITEYNRQSDFEWERIRDFLILHYRANERAGAMWAACRDMAIPDTLRHKLDVFAAHGQIFREHEELFAEAGWVQVLIGQGVRPAAIHPLAEGVPAADLQGYMADMARLLAHEAAKMPSHADFLAANAAAAPMR